MAEGDRLLQRARRDPFFLGQALETYQATHGLSDDELAALLECGTKSLARLALCRRPDDERPSFREDVGKIAAFAECNPQRLVLLLRELAAMRALTEAKVEGGLLMAARDRRGAMPAASRDRAKRRARQDSKK